jgi:MFS transporter, ACS family, tartrate transporter
MSIETAVIGKINRRVIPILVLASFLAYVDRVNVAFAAIGMNKDLGFSPAVYGWGAGIFFIGYFFFEIPSNLALERFGSRLWIARIMLSWGIISSATAFVWNKESFYVLRFLLGVAEAGFFPGLVLYMTYWVPAKHRARLSSYFMVTIPLSGVIGAPISGLLLSTDGLFGLRGWQLMFLLEGLPSVALAFVIWKVLQDSPARAPWLTESERQWLATTLRSEATTNTKSAPSLARVLFDPRLILFSLAFFGLVACNYGVAFWLPQIVKSFGFSSGVAGGLVAIPFAAGAVCMVLNARRSDLKLERRWHTAVPPVVAAIGLAGSTLAQGPAGKIALITLAACGIYAVLAPFWSLASQSFPGSAAAASIALVNSVGNLAGFAGPYAMGYFKEATGTFSPGLLFVSALGLLSAAIVLFVTRAGTYPRAVSKA